MSDAKKQFVTYGELVKPEDVPDLVRAGREVWSYGYGVNLPDNEFTTIDESDLWAWDGPRADPYIVWDWSPFRVAPIKEWTHFQADTPQRILDIERAVDEQGFENVGEPDDGP